MAEKEGIKKETNTKDIFKSKANHIKYFSEQ